MPHPRQNIAHAACVLCGARPASGGLRAVPRASGFARRPSLQEMSLLYLADTRQTVTGRVTHCTLGQERNHDCDSDLGSAACQPSGSAEAGATSGAGPVSRESPRRPSSVDEFAVWFSKSLSLGPDGLLRAGHTHTQTLTKPEM